MERKLNIAIIGVAKNNIVNIQVGNSFGTLNLLTGKGVLTETVPCEASITKTAEHIVDFIVSKESLQRINAASVMFN
jgi:hypothetical protein